MKFLYKSLLIASLALCMTSATALATETQEVKSTQENISFDYQTNTFTIDAGTGAEAEEELTIMLVKGDFVGTEANLSNISTSDIYYLAQEYGKKYDIFEDLGVKYDSNKFTPGVYTLMTCGETVTMKKTKLVIGNALSKEGFGEYLPDDMKNGDYEFGTVGQTVRYYPGGEDGNYIYVCNAIFPSIASLEKAGFLFQNISNTQGTKYLVKSLKEFNMNDTLAGIRSLEANIQVGIQINDIPVVTSEAGEAVDNIVAIPYVKNESIGG